MFLNMTQVGNIAPLWVYEYYFIINKNYQAFTVVAPADWTDTIDMMKALIVSLNFLNADFFGRDAYVHAF